MNPSNSKTYTWHAYSRIFRLANGIIRGRLITQYVVTRSMRGLTLLTHIIIIMNISCETIANLAQGKVNADEIAQAQRLVDLGSTKESLVQQLNKVNADLDSEIKIPAPAELLDDTIGAMSEGVSLKEYCEQHGKNAWDMTLYTMPKDCDAWKARKKEAKRIKEARNLQRFSETISIVEQAIDEGTATITTNRVKSLKSGGHSFVVAGRIDGEKSDDRLTFKDLQDQINAKSI